MPDKPDEELVREFTEAMRDPLRRRMLMSLGEDEALTIRQLAATLDEPTRRIRHQIEVLVARRLVVVESERPRRGTMERTFRAVPKLLLGPDDWPEGMEPHEMKLVLLDILRYTFDEVSGAIVAGTFLDRDGWCAARMLRRVDLRGWQELAEIHERAIRDALSAADAAERRLADSGEEPIRAITSMFLFELLPREA